MKNNLLFAFSLACLGVSLLIAYSQNQAKKKLNQGHLDAVTFEVLEITARARGTSGSRLSVKYVDPISKTATQKSLPLLINSDEAAQKFPVGKLIQGWIHTGLDEAYLGEKPDFESLAQDERKVALFFLGVGLLLSVMAIYLRLKV